MVVDNELNIAKAGFLEAYNDVLNDHGISADSLDNAGSGAYIQMVKAHPELFPRHLRSLIGSAFKGIPISRAMLVFHPVGTIVSVEPTEEAGFRHPSGELVSPRTEMVTNPTVELHFEDDKLRVFREPFAQHERSARLLMSEKAWQKSMRPLRARLVSDMISILRNPDSIYPTDKYYGNLSEGNVSIIIAKQPQP